MSRRFQFSLSDLLIAVFVAGVFGGLSGLILRDRVFPKYEDLSVVLLAIEMVVLLAVGVLSLAFESRESTRRVRYGTVVLWTGLVWGFSTLVGFSFSRSRIQANEAAAEAFCMQYRKAQEIYSLVAERNGKHHTYALSLGELSKVNGPGNVLITPEQAAAEGPPGKAKPYRGYCFMVLTCDTVDPATQKSLTSDGKMTLSYGLVAYPEQYGKSGVHCYVMYNDGLLSRKDFGPHTTEEMRNQKHPRLTSHSPEVE